MLLSEGLEIGSAKDCVYRNYKQIIALYTCQSCSIYKIRLKKLEV